jgi:hypothetical protein
MASISSRLGFMAPSTAVQTEPLAQSAAEEPASSLEKHLPPVLSLASGRAVRASRSGPDDVIELIGKDGQLEIAVIMTDRGPILRVDAARIELRADAMALRCNELDVECGERMSVRCDGASEEVVRGAKSTTVLQKWTASGRAIDLHAQGGELSVSASENLRIDGKNVLINC